MSNDMSKPTILFNLAELIFEPLKHMSWITSVVKKPPVKIVTSLHVECNHFALCIELEGLRVESIFSEYFGFLLTQPIGVGPATFEMVDGPVGVWLREILNIYRPGVVITHYWIDSDI